jgi:hypothetical protein
MNRTVETEKLCSWKAMNDTTYPLGARHGLIVGNPPLDGVGEWRKLARLDKTEELLVGNIGARPVRHRSSKVLDGLEAQAAALLRMRKISERRGECERKKKIERQSPKPAPDARF